MTTQQVIDIIKGEDDYKCAITSDFCKKDLQARRIKIEDLLTKNKELIRTFNEDNKCKITQSDIDILTSVSFLMGMLKSKQQDLLLDICFQQDRVIGNINEEDL